MPEFYQYTPAILLLTFHFIYPNEECHITADQFIYWDWRTTFQGLSHFKVTSILYCVLIHYQIPFIFFNNYVRYTQGLLSEIKIFVLWLGMRPYCSIRPGCVMPEMFGTNRNDTSMHGWKVRIKRLSLRIQVVYSARYHNQFITYYVLKKLW
jgi:hypothetical protein